MIEEILKNKPGFIAALDQSGGSSKKTLALYDVNEDMYQNEEEMFKMIHQMRERIITNSQFLSDKIIAVILFKKTMTNNIDGVNTVTYLKNKGILSFLKIDVGLEDKNDGVRLLKNIPNLEKDLQLAKEKGVVGTKMRSVIYEYNEFGIKSLIREQFELAKIIAKYDLIPIIEPEVDIHSPAKRQIEHFMKKIIKEELNKLDQKVKIIFKLSLPSENNFYNELLHFPNVLRIVALSGGYDQKTACLLLKKNKKMIASFSRALLEGLSILQTPLEFTKVLQESINLIYDASINK